MIKPAVNRFSVAMLALFAGQAIGQQHHQGTINRQRPVLSSYATDGLLSTYSDSRFWFWNLLSFDSAYDPQDDRHENSARWVHVLTSETPGYLIDPISLNPDATKIAALAAEVVTEAASLVGEDLLGSDSYGLFIQNWGEASNLTRNTDDELSSVPEDANGGLYKWATADGYPTESTATSANTATPWRSHSAADSNAIFQMLVSQIISQTNAYNQSNTPQIPIPSRFFLDDENQYFEGAGADLLAVYDSLLNDSRSGGAQAETLLGDFTNWTTAPSPVLDDIFSAVGFNSAYTPWFSYPTIPNSGNDLHQYSDYVMHRSLLSAAHDGASEAAIEQTLQAAWPGCLWSNYGTSAWYSDDYPLFSRGNLGTPRTGASIGYGWSTVAANGSADMQSPILYPVHRDHSLEYERDGTSNETLEQRLRTAIMYNRQQLDHAIFSFDAIPQAPRHIVPWVPTAGTGMSIPGGSTTVPKSHSRDVLALCKSKGINEVIMWGDTSNGNSTESREQWEQSNDAISQVWSYNLREIYVPALLDSLSTTELEQAKFAEEHTYDLAPVVTTSGGTLSAATFHVDFDVDRSIGSVGENYTLVLEALDGGGPWSGAPISVSVYNFQTGAAGAWEDLSTLSGTHDTLPSTSTRRVIFDDTDSDPLYDAWHYEFDDDSIVSDVSDRKSIHKWTFQLPSASDKRRSYLHAVDLKMRFRIEIENDAPIPFEGTADPFRIDLVQLYESETSNNNIQPQSGEFAIGDLDYDGDLDQDDMTFWYHNYQSNQGALQLDLNDDGAANIDDMVLIYTLLNS